MSEQSLSRSLSWQSQGEHRSRRRRLAITGGLAAATLALVACGSSTSPNTANASSSGTYNTSAPGNQAGNASTSPSLTIRNYCDDSVGNRAQPISVKDHRLVVAIHGECTGDPTAPVGLYKTPTQEAGHAAVALPNGAQFDARCIAKGEYVRTDEASSGNPPGHTGSFDWLEGTDPTHPEAGDLYVPWSNTGFVVTTLGGVSLGPC